MAKLKCEICGNEIKTTFLNKLIGTYFRDSKGKKHLICNNCQRTHTREEIKEILG